MREAQRDEESLKRALEVARNEVAQATEEQRAKFDQQIKVLMEKLAEAEARNLRAKSMAEQTAPATFISFPILAPSERRSSRSA